jgi:hypothetical protein
MRKQVSAAVVHRHMHTAAEEHNDFRKRVLGVLRAIDNERLRRRAMLLPLSQQRRSA